MGRKDLYEEKFQFDSQTFSTVAKFVVYELDNGIVVAARPSEFDDLMKISEPDEDGMVTIRLQGRVVNRRLKSNV